MLDSLQQGSHQGQLPVAVGMIPHPEVWTVPPDEDAPLMRERVVACLAVIAAHAGIAHSAEGHVPHGYVDEGVVHTAAAKGTA